MWFCLSFAHARSRFQCDIAKKKEKKEQQTNVEGKIYITSAHMSKYIHQHACGAPAFDLIRLESVCQFAYYSI